MINPAASSEKVRKVRRRRQRLRRRLIRGGEVLFVVAVVVIVVGVLLRKDPKPAAAPFSSTTMAPGPEANDVRLGRCSYNNFAASAPVTITNHSGQTFNYVVRVTFLSEGQYFASAVVTQDNLHASDTVHIRASGVTTLGNPAKLTCSVTTIQRFD